MSASYDKQTGLPTFYKYVRETHSDTDNQSLFTLNFDMTELIGAAVVQRRIQFAEQKSLAAQFKNIMVGQIICTSEAYYCDDETDEREQSNIKPSDVDEILNEHYELIVEEMCEEPGQLCEINGLIRMNPNFRYPFLLENDAGNIIRSLHPSQIVQDSMNY
tara:strand:+ start:93 stop:575 length:483 start_codon:yes stop_codon:yes gene_type:complete